jgi:predicted dehydrogenase
MSCNIWYSKCALGNRNGLNLRVYGDKGAVRWVQEDPEVLHLADNHGRRSIIDRATNGVSVCNQPRYCRFKAGHPAGFIEAFANYYDDLAEAIREHKKGNSAYISEHSYGIQEALEGLKLFEAASRSSKSGRWENIGDL